MSKEKPAPEQYTALEQALTRLQKRYAELEAKVAAQPAPVQEPIGYAVPTFDFDNSVIKKVHYAGTVPLYTTPPAAQRQWVGLTDDEVEKCVKYCRSAEGLAQAIEAKLKEKNT
jgi:hypothetical protein